MSALHGLAANLADQAPLPDLLLRAAVASRVARTRRRLATLNAVEEELRFVAAMTERPIAEFAEVANRQHYELPPAFFGLVLGPRRKYSCCLYADPSDTLAEAEERALAVTAEHAALADGQRILELGCGWGSLSLWMAERYRNAKIVSVSNSKPQREFIEARAASLGLGNLEVITADANGFAPTGRYDRIVSVEMFEHVANWPALLDRVASWLNPAGRAFLHVFCHRAVPYRFDRDNARDWIAEHFFTGGLMPSHGLLARATRGLEIESSWRWNGDHYRRTALDWLANFDRNADAIRAILAPVYGREVAIWMRRWRIFFLATAGLFGDNGGAEWGVSHFRLRAA
jgi:cyclopropane-fatty-acyl-phospholipid synthase